MRMRLSFYVSDDTVITRKLSRKLLVGVSEMSKRNKKFSIPK